MPALYPRCDIQYLKAGRDPLPSGGRGKNKANRKKEDDRGEAAGVGTETQSGGGRIPSPWHTEKTSGGDSLPPSGRGKHKAQRKKKPTRRNRRKMEGSARLPRRPDTAGRGRQPSPWHTERTSGGGNTLPLAKKNKKCSNTPNCSTLRSSHTRAHPSRPTPPTRFQHLSAPPRPKRAKKKHRHGPQDNESIMHTRKRETIRLICDLSGLDTFASPNAIP